MEHDDRCGEVTALFDLATGERYLRRDDAFIPDANRERRPAMAADGADHRICEDAYPLAEHHRRTAAGDHNAVVDIAPAPTVTSPTTLAVGATRADGSTLGAIPLRETNIR